ncbi:HEAT repeat domain-containing protein [Thermodesulfobacteriota bacterium]
MIYPARTTFYHGFLQTLLALILLCSLPVSISIAEEIQNTGLLDRALEAIAVKRSDLSIRSDLSTNPFASSLFKRWMEHPLKAPSEAQNRASKLLDVAPKGPEEWFLELNQLADTGFFKPIPLQKYAGDGLPSHWPEELRQGVQLILDGLFTAGSRMHALFNRVKNDERFILEEYLYPDFFQEDDRDDEEQALPDLIKLRKAFDLAGQVDQKRIMEAGLTLLSAVSEALNLLTGTENQYGNIRTFSMMTPLGRIIIGGPDADVHDGPAALIIDLGGDDLYRGKVAAGEKGRCALVIDLKGNDIYLGEKITQGAGLWGIGVLLDLKGNDLYRAADFAQGAGLFGIGLLMDWEGSDRYLGNTFVQAASSWGRGGLIDLAGEDTFECRHSGQAYAGVRAISGLCDLGGNDKYISGAGEPDPRETDMNQSFSQGFAFGARNLAAGGIALLADRSGNDLYQCQYFGQGSSYWMGVGILYDEAGKDTYLARRYAQGAGIHFSLGLLLDTRGNDHTSSWGVSQGCGHDYGVGILINETGDDTYSSAWLSMGASEANGVGIFVDNSGNDGYESSSGMAVGRLINLRRAGGIGLFIDAGGIDRYSKSGEDNSIWAANRWGVGMDEEGGGLSGLNLSRPDEPAPVNPEFLKKLTKEKARLSSMITRADELPNLQKVEVLLSLASHWGYEKDVPEQAREELLLLEPEHSIPAMTAFLDTPNTMSIGVMTRFFTVHAYLALPELIKAAGEGDTLSRSRALYFLGLLKDTRALQVCLAAIEKPSWRVKAGAVRALGEMLNQKRLQALDPMRKTLKAALKTDDSDVIKKYLQDAEKIKGILSVLMRASPIDYQTYKRFEDIEPGENEKSALEEYSKFIFSHLDKMLPLLEMWIHDIHQSEDISPGLQNLLTDPEPAVKRTAAYALGQMRYEPAIPDILLLLNDSHFWVRDAAVLSLALFGETVIDPLASTLSKGTSSYKILVLDVLSRIDHERSHAVVEKYVEDPDPNVRRFANQAVNK